MSANAADRSYEMDPSTLQSWATSIGRATKGLVDVVHAAGTPISHDTGDGSELPPEEQTATGRAIAGVPDVLSHFGIRDYKTLLETWEHAESGDPIDDRSYLMEGLIAGCATLEDSNDMGKKLTQKFVSTLWNDLQHPPQSYLGNKYQYRQPDGSYNNFYNPQLGAANMPYARTAAPKKMQKGALPDPGVLFDSLMSRKHTEDHPNKISSVLFYVASIIIHDCFRTDHEDFRNSKTSSYLDLSPLYGSVWEEQKQMRTFNDGKIKPDCFYEKRLLNFPPGVGVLLIMFNRFHNNVVEQLALINEGGKFAPKEGVRPKKAEEYDEDLFQTGRLVTCGLYVNIILIDYVRTILNLNKTDSNWQLNPRANVPGLPLGTGNQVAAEFNLVYRWHSAISDRDAKWTEAKWKELFGERKAKDVDNREFIGKLMDLDQKLGKDPMRFPLEGPEGGFLKRDPDTQKFNDDDLVKIMVDSIKDCANSFGANRVPAVMRAIEVLGIEQARAWNVATLNEFRSYFHLKPHRKFSDINPDPYVVEQLKHLYDTPDQVELYPGLVVEDAKQPWAPGAGLTPPYTASRAVLSDAVALVRGDRFYTTDYHPKKLTNWGYSEVQYNVEIDNGCMFYKLFARAFPDHFQANSIYAHYPLTVPSAMKIALKERADKYSWAEPKRKAREEIILSYKTAKEVLERKDDFHVTWGPAMEWLMGEEVEDFMLAGDGNPNAESRTMMGKAIYVDQWQKDVKEYYEMITKRLLKQKYYRLGDDLNQVGIIRDVSNYAHVHFGAELFMLPLKTEEGLGRFNLYTENQLYMVMVAVFTCVFFDLDPGSSFYLRQKAREVTQQLGKLVQANVELIRDSGGWLHGVGETNLKHYGIHLIQRLLEKKMPVKNLVWGHIMGTAGGMIPNQGQLFAQIIEYYLCNDEGKKHIEEIRTLAKSDKDEDFEKLKHYIREGGRLNGETAVFREVQGEFELNDNGRKIKLNKGDRLFVNLRAASHDEEKWGKTANEVDPKPRDEKDYIHLGYGQHQCLGQDMTTTALTAMFKVIFRLERLRPAAGPQGKIAKITKPFDGGLDKLPESSHYHMYLTDTHDSYFPFPCSLKVNWDGEMPF